VSKTPLDLFVSPFPSPKWSYTPVGSPLGAPRPVAAAPCKRSSASVLFRQQGPLIPNEQCRERTVHWSDGQPATPGQSTTAEGAGTISPNEVWSRHIVTPFTSAHVPRTTLRLHHKRPSRLVPGTHAKCRLRRRVPAGARGAIKSRTTARVLTTNLRELHSTVIQFDRASFKFRKELGHAQPVHHRAGVSSETPQHDSNANDRTHLPQL
jgi:hypothetical protein